MVSHALKLVREGWPVFPLEAHGKKPIGHLVPKGFKNATKDPQQVAKWWATEPKANIGLAIPEGFVVIDIDPRNGGNINALTEKIGQNPRELTLVARTGGGGFHVWFRIPPGVNIAELGRGVDIKMGGRGYVVAPGSVTHESVINSRGGPYSWENSLLIYDLPESLAQPASEPRARARVVGTESEITDEQIKDARVAIEPYFTEGQKHNLALALGGWLAQRGWPEEDVVELVRSLPSNDPEARVRAALACYRAPNANGWHALCGLIGEDAANALDRVIANPARDEELEIDAQLASAIAEASALETAPVQPEAGMSESRGVLSEGRASATHDPRAEHLIRSLADPTSGVFQRGGTLVEVVREPVERSGEIRANGVPRIRTLPAARLGEIASQLGGPDLAKVANTVAARGQWDHIRPLDSIVTCPVLRPDGSVLSVSGYDLRARTLAEIDIQISVPEHPTQDDAVKARRAIEELLCDFAFESDADRAAWTCGLLTIFARPAIDGPTPMLLLEASERGSGKTLLGDLIGVIATGDLLPRRTAAPNEEEWRKEIFAALRAGDPILLFDNVTGMLRSAALDAVLTGTSYKSRVLGESRDENLPVRCFLIATSNNARMSTDLVRRTLRCRIDPGVERPEARTKFRYPDLLMRARQVRAYLVSCALTILRAYFVAGRPPATGRTMGSYGEWARVVRDAYLWAGGADPAATQDALRESADVERDELESLLEAWYGHFGEREATLADLREAARQPGEDGGPSPLWDAIQGMLPTNVQSQRETHVLGNRLKSVVGQIVGGKKLVRVERENRSKKSQQYRVVIVSSGPV